MPRVGIVGSGSMGRVHAAAWRELGIQPVGVQSRHQASADRLAIEIGARSYDDLGALIEDVDVVDVCAPTAVHAQLTLASLAAGRHVICEKPVALTLDDADAMASAAETSVGRLFIGHVVRYYPEYSTAKRAIDRGVIGEPTVIRLSREAGPPTGPRSGWLLDPAQSGGILVDFLIHDYDFARWIAGEIRSVFAALVRVGPSPMSDVAIVVLQHARGAITHVVGSWAQPSAVFRTRFDIAGSHGSLVHDSSARRGLTVTRKAGSLDAGLPMSPLAETPHASELGDFLNAIETGGEPLVNVSDASAALRIALAAAQSLRSGEAVDL